MAVAVLSIFFRVLVVSGVTDKMAFFTMAGPVIG
jgi:hypothetical protein